jgi:guanylate kinase
MNKPLFLFVGRSASGKTTIANVLSDRCGLKQVESYTTRQPRFDGETGHIFVSEDEFQNLGALAAYTYYNNRHYGTTIEQLDDCSIYVVDVPGVETLLQNYKTDRLVCILYFDATVYTRIRRMLDRHDSDMEIVARLLQDEKDDWHMKLDALVRHHSKLENRAVELYKVNANENLTDVMDQVLCYMNQHMEG